MQFEKRPDFLGDDSTARSTVVCLGPPQHFLREALNATVLPSPAVLAKMGHNAPKIPNLRHEPGRVQRVPECLTSLVLDLHNTSPPPGCPTPRPCNAFRPVPLSWCARCGQRDVREHHWPQIGPGGNNGRRSAQAPSPATSGYRLAVKAGRPGLRRGGPPPRSSTDPAMPGRRGRRLHLGRLPPPTLPGSELG
ncbi:hypothetical protein Naga_101341g1 [Nannochloropsis gaditana]|uniref:Uncharacterized protein n=1 Tax=Nannochloropsis gaditana TaxID=72520 RepID=W7TSC9_9STRA|nr:hypothetical protein Naga_101341g1 [Nannochloropsis gaditana]